MQETKAAADNFDMFSTDKVDDMFGDAPVGAPVPLQNAPKRGLLDNYDDSEGYYNFQVSWHLLHSKHFEIHKTQS